jgi:hypothetical protein
MTDDREYVTAYTPAEAETLRRCNEGEQVSASDLLLMFSTDVRILEDLAEGVSELATPITNDEELWGVLNELRVFIAGIKRRSDRWRKGFLGYPDELTWWPPPMSALELDYLCNLRVRAYGRSLGFDPGLVYASERFLAFDEWPTYAKRAAENGARILAMIGDAPLATPISAAEAKKMAVVDGPSREWAVRLAIFADPNVRRTEAVLLMPDGRLITWDDLTIRLETARAPAMTELIEQAATAELRVNRKPAGTGLDQTRTSMSDIDARLKALAADWADERNWERFIAEEKRCASTILEGHVILVIESSGGWYWHFSYFEPGGKPLYSRDDGYFPTYAEAKASAFEAFSKVIRDNEDSPEAP